MALKKFGGSYIPVDLQRKSYTVGTSIQIKDADGNIIELKDTDALLFQIWQELQAIREVISSL
jgi:hypothetical protein